MKVAAVTAAPITPASTKVSLPFQLPFSSAIAAAAADASAGFSHVPHPRSAPFAQTIHQSEVLLIAARWRFDLKTDKETSAVGRLNILSVAKVESAEPFLKSKRTRGSEVDDGLLRISKTVDAAYSTYANYSVLQSN